MYSVKIIEVEGSGYPNHEYCQYVGTGMSRSPKTAMIMARRALRDSFVRGGSRREPMWTGTPVYAQVTILHNNRQILVSDDSPGPWWSRQYS